MCYGLIFIVCDDGVLCYVDFFCCLCELLDCVCYCIVVFCVVFVCV